MSAATIATFGVFIWQQSATAFTGGNSCEKTCGWSRMTTCAAHGPTVDCHCEDSFFGFYSAPYCTVSDCPTSLVDYIRDAGTTVSCNPHGYDGPGVCLEECL